MKVLLGLVFFATAATLFASCGSVEDFGSMPITGDIKELYPLKTGNEWVIEVQEFSPGTLIPIKIDTLYMRIADSLTYTYDGHGAFLEYVGSIPTYFIGYDSTGTLYSDHVPILYAPMSIGQRQTLFYSSWSIGLDTGFNKGTLTLSALNVPKTTPAGTFNTCALFENVFATGTIFSTGHTIIDSSKLSLSLSYYASHVGNVYQEDYFWQNGTKYLKYKRSLLSYKIQ